MQSFFLSCENNPQGVYVVVVVRVLDPVECTGLVLLVQPCRRPASCMQTLHTSCKLKDFINIREETISE